MISGTGIDIIEVERVKEKISRNSAFREFVFSIKEIEYCETKPNKYEHYAACFATKEAFLKALGSGWTNGISLNEIEVHHDENGRPQLKVHGDTEKKIEQMGKFNISVSISHLKTIAVAIVIMEKDSDKIV